MNDSTLSSQSTDAVSQAVSNTYPDLNSLLGTIREAASLPPSQRKAFRIHGSGSHDFFGESLEGELLETRGLSGIVQYEPSELVVTVGAFSIDRSSRQSHSRRYGGFRLEWPFQSQRRRSP